MGQNSIMSDVYYKVTVTRDDTECTLYWWEKTYTKLMESVDFLYKYAKVDAVVLEMISKKEYNDNYC
jgi:hypothetical protein